MGLISILCGIIIYHLIEFPFTIHRKKSFLIYLGVLFVIIFGLNQALDNFNIRNNIGGVFTTESAKYFRTGGCDDSVLIGSKYCEWNIGFNNSVVVVGDSQATFALDGIVPAASRNKLKVVSAARLGCPFMVNTLFNDSSEKCYKIRENVWKYISDAKPSFVVISNLSTGYLKSSRATFSNSGVKCPDLNGMGCKGYEDAIMETVSKLESMNIKVILIQTIPNFVGEFERKFLDLNPKLSTSREKLFNTRYPTFISEKNIASQTGLILIDPFDVLCSKDECPLKKAQKFLYANEFHMSTWGAMQLIPKLDSAFRRS